MSIRFPKSCKTRAQRSAHASRVARIRWERRRSASEPEFWVGAIVFSGPLAGGKTMRLDLVSQDGTPKWQGYCDGEPMRTRLSERAVLRMVKGVLRTPRQPVPVSTPAQWSVASPRDH